MRTFYRLNITGEGQTEERFVKEALSTYLGAFNIATDVRRVLMSKNRHHKYRGGLSSYLKARNDIRAWLKEDNNPEVRFTTMLDLYGLPDDFPGYKDSLQIRDVYQRVEFLESKFFDDIGDTRFIPYVQLHEFEALVLANPQNLKYEYFEHESAIEELITTVKSFDDNPEKINDSKETAPSKRILKLIPEYDKVNAGASIAAITGIDFLKLKCKHFGDWLNKLERLNEK